MKAPAISVPVVAALLSILGSAVQAGIVALAVAISLAGTPAVGATPSRAVRYDDLNLSASAGVAVLYSRLESAATAVCGDAQRVGSHFVSAAWRDCVAGAVDRAVAQVDRPALTAYHAARTGRTALQRTAALARPGSGN